MRQALWIGVCLLVAFTIVWSHRPKSSPTSAFRPAARSAPPLPVGPPVTFTYTSVAPTGSPRAGRKVLHRRTMQALAFWLGAASDRPSPYLLQVDDRTPYGQREIKISSGPGAGGVAVTYGARSGSGRKRWVWVAPSLRVDRVGPLLVTSAVYRFPGGAARVLPCLATEPCHFSRSLKSAVVLDDGSNSGLVSGPE